MFLRSLTLKGFKSFADATTLEFEPGVTVVAGPNGTGKSNIVDAVAWVLGAQGPRTVRSAKMDDVIFAGTNARAALGRAEVSLTIDNAARRLPIDFTEVTVTRTLFRTGESEYTLNGVPCRLLDIQELLSDTGVGRQQHVIVGQGQLDAILSARPEDRRMVIEEAAGVLKFRRRRERAERRLEASELNLVRLQDLLREVRRQLKPLARQAEAARRQEGLTSELTALGLHLAGLELAELSRRRETVEESARALAAEDRRISSELGRVDETVTGAERALIGTEGDGTAALLARVMALDERARGLGRLVAERRRSATAALEASLDAEVVATLEADAASLQAELQSVAVSLGSLEPERDELAREQGGLAGAAELASIDEEVERRSRQVAELRERQAGMAERSTWLERRTRELRSALEGLEAEAGPAAASVDEVAAERDRCARAEESAAEVAAETDLAHRAAERDLHALRGKAEALGLALDEARARAGLERLKDLDGLLGTLLDLVEVDPGYELAFEAATAGALEAIVVAGPREAQAALDVLASRGEGVLLLVPPAASPAPFGTPPGCEPLRRHVRARSGAGSGEAAGHGAGVATGGGGPWSGEAAGHGAGVATGGGAAGGAERLLDLLLGPAVVCAAGADEAARIAIEIATKAPPATATVVVTPAGDRFAATGWRIGRGGAAATRAAFELASSEAIAAAESAGAALRASVDARARHDRARSARDEAARRHDTLSSDQRRRQQSIADLSSELASLETEGRSALAARSELDLAAATAAGELAERSSTLEERRELAERARLVGERRASLDARTAGLEERRALLAGRLEQVERRLAGRQAERAEAAARRELLERSRSVLERLGEVLETALAGVETARRTLVAEQARLEAGHRATVETLESARRQRASLERSLQGVRERLRRAELDQAELRLRHESAVEALRHDLDAEPEAALSAPCPELAAGTSPTARALELERELRVLGPVNPLALEELVALEERALFLEGQLEDVRDARRELGRVMKAVDAEIVQVFEVAFADVAAHFEALFATLFPGGSGRLVLTDPANLLDTGVEVEARPAGRNVRRLSLLSGGERSLAALSFLFAVFRSRPSPFYLMDEVEAALDDVNLHRFLDLLEEFRHDSQLIIVSHQKRTMDTADALLGVTMRPGGASKVVSERVTATSST